MAGAGEGPRSCYAGERGGEGYTAPAVPEEVDGKGPAPSVTEKDEVSLTRDHEISADLVAAVHFGRVVVF